MCCTSLSIPRLVLYLHGLCYINRILVLTSKSIFRPVTDRNLPITQALKLSVFSARHLWILEICNFLQVFSVASFLKANLGGPAHEGLKLICDNNSFGDNLFGMCNFDFSF